MLPAGFLFASLPAILSTLLRGSIIMHVTELTGFIDSIDERIIDTGAPSIPGRRRIESGLSLLLGDD